MALPETGVKLVAENEGGFLRSLNRATGAVNSFENSTRGASLGTIAMGTAIGNLVAGGLRQVAGLAVRGGQAVAGFLSDSIGLASGLEAQMSGVAAVLGASNEEIEELNQLVIDLGIDPNLKVSSLEAAQAIEVLAKNGLDMADIMNGAARNTVFLANATGAEFATAADIATDVMAIFGFEAEEMGTAVNGISAVVQSSKFDINDYALALANGGSVASSVGVSFDDFNTAIAAISPSFSSGMTAGTAMKNLLLRLAPGTAKAADEMANLGIITEDGGNAFFDAEGNMKSMAEIAGVLQIALGGLSDEQKAQSLRTIFGNDAMSAAIALAEVGQEEFEALGATMSEVDAGEAAATRVDNLAGSMDILDGTIEAVKLQIGDAFIPILTQLAQKFAEFVEINGPKIIDFFSELATFMGQFFTGLLEGQGVFDSLGRAFESVGIDTTFLENLKGIFTSVFGFIVDNKDAIVGAIKAIITAFGAFFALSSIASILSSFMNPLNLLILGIGALGAIWSGNVGNIQGIADMLVKIAAVRLKPVSDSATVLAQEVMPILAENVTKASWIMRFFLFDALQKASEAATNLWAVFTFFLFGALKKASEAATDLKENLIILGQEASPILAENTTKASWILRFFLFDALKKASEAATGLWGIIKEGLAPVLNVLWGFITIFLVPGLKLLWTWIKEKVTDALDGMQEAANNLKPFLDGIKDAFIGITDAIKDAVTQFLIFIGLRDEARTGQLVAPGEVRPAGPQRPTSGSVGPGGIRPAIQDQSNENVLPPDISNPDVDPLLQPGSPSPLETSLMGIASAMQRIVEIAPQFQEAIQPPATASQIVAGAGNVDNSQNITLNNSFANQPTVTDRNVLISTLAGL